MATALVTASAVASAQGVLTVTSPADGEFVGSSTTISFRVENASFQVTVRARITSQVSGQFTTLETRVIPDPTNRNATGSLTWNPSTAFPEGLYEIFVTATEQGNTYNSVTLEVTLDRIEPRFREFSPLEGSSVRDTVVITAELDEPNIEEWRVTVNDADLPNNTGKSSSVSVDWDTANIEEDGEQIIKIVVKDRAGNTTTQNITVQLDRAAPQVNVTFPRTNMTVRPQSILAVIAEIVDATSTSVDVMAVVVEIRDMSDNLIRRVSRLRYSGVNDTTARWIGRVRVQLPPGVREFKVVVTAVDKAGNAAVPQHVPLRLGR